MKEAEIFEGNKLIAEFMGGEFYPDTTTIMKVPIISPTKNEVRCIDKLRYHESFDWLVTVLEKICRMKIGDGFEFVDYAYPRTFGMISQETEKIMVRLNGFPLHEADTLIEATWLAVTDFIKWFNTQQK